MRKQGQTYRTTKRFAHDDDGKKVAVGNTIEGDHMSTIDERRERASAGVALQPDTDRWFEDFARPRVILQPIAAPSVLGLFAFAGATLIVASNLAGWCGSEDSSLYLAP